MSSSLYQARTLVKLLDDLVTALERDGVGRLVRTSAVLRPDATHVRLVLDSDDAVAHLAGRLGYECRQGKRGARARGRAPFGTLALAVEVGR